MCFFQLSPFPSITIDEYVMVETLTNTKIHFSPKINQCITTRSLAPSSWSILYLYPNWIINIINNIAEHCCLWYQCCICYFFLWHPVDDIAYDVEWRIPLNFIVLRRVHLLNLVWHTEIWWTEKKECFKKQKIMTMSLSIILYLFQLHMACWHKSKNRKLQNLSLLTVYESWKNKVG